MDCHSLLQEIFSTQESNPHPLHFWRWQVESVLLSRLGSPIAYTDGAQYILAESANEALGCLYSTVSLELKVEFYHHVTLKLQANHHQVYGTHKVLVTIYEDSHDTLVRLSLSAIQKPARQDQAHSG